MGEKELVIVEVMWRVINLNSSFDLLIKIFSCIKMKQVLLKTKILFLLFFLTVYKQVLPMDLSLVECDTDLFLDFQGPGPDLDSVLSDEEYFELVFSKEDCISNSPEEVSPEEISSKEVSPEKLSSEEKKIIVAIKELEDSRKKNGGKYRLKVELELLIKLYEIKFGEITKKTRFHAKDFESYLAENGISVTNGFLRCFLFRFKKSLPEEMLPEELSPEEKNIIVVIKELEDSRKKNGVRYRLRVESELLIKLYEIKFGEITKKTRFNVKDFKSYLAENGISVAYFSLRRYLFRFKKLSPENRNKRRLEVDKYLDGLEEMSSEEENIIVAIKELEDSRKKNNGRCRLKMELWLLIKLYEIKFGEITKKTQLHAKDFESYLAENGISATYYSLYRSLLRFKKLSSKEKNKRRLEVDKYLDGPEEILEKEVLKKGGLAELDIKVSKSLSPEGLNANKNILSQDGLQSKKLNEGLGRRFASVLLYMIHKSNERLSKQQASLDKDVILAIKLLEKDDAKLDKASKRFLFCGFVIKLYEKKYGKIEEETMLNNNFYNYLKKIKIELKANKFKKTFEGFKLLSNEKRAGVRKIINDLLKVFGRERASSSRSDVACN